MLLADTDLKEKPFERSAEGHYIFRTPKTAYKLAEYLAKKCKSQQLVCMGLKELCFNAIEHGNLEIGFEEKGRLIDEDLYMDELERRLTTFPYSQRKVRLKVSKSDGKVTFKIADEGKGFDPSPFLEVALRRISISHGRGIALANLACFDKVSYSKAGNIVQCTASA